AQALLQVVGTHEGLLHLHLLVEDHPDQQRERIGLEQLVGGLVLRPDDGHGSRELWPWWRSTASTHLSTSTPTPAAAMVPWPAPAGAARRRRGRGSAPPPSAAAWGARSGLPPRAGA